MCVFNFSPGNVTGNKRSAAMLGGKYSLNIWILLIPRSCSIPQVKLVRALVTEEKNFQPGQANVIIGVC